MSAAELWRKPGKEESLWRRHPWVDVSAVACVRGNPASGATVTVRGADGRFLAWAADAPASTLRARCGSFDASQAVDAGLLAQRVHAAVARRTPLAQASDALRRVCGEADGLPGFVADRYADWPVAQLQSAGAERWRAVLIEALAAATGCARVYDRSDRATRQREGLPATSGPLRGGEPPLSVELREHGLRDAVDVVRGHKTGCYIDQRDNRQRVRALAALRAGVLGRAPRVPTRTSP